MTCLTRKRKQPDSDDDEIDASTIFKAQKNFAKFLIIESNPFVIEKQIDALIGTAKSVKRLKKRTLLVETIRKTQTEQLLKTNTFFNLHVEVSERKTLNLP